MFLPFHLAVFVLALGVLAGTWQWLKRLPPLPARRARRWALALCALAAFVLSRYVNLLPLGRPLPDEAVGDPGMFWTVLLLDLGIVLPATIACATGLWRGRPRATPALYGLMGWFALVPPSVTAMAAVMVLNDDPHAGVGTLLVLAVGAAVFMSLTVLLFLPLFRRDPRPN